MKNVIKSIFSFRIIALFALLAIVALAAYAALNNGGDILRDDQASTASTSAQTTSSKKIIATPTAPTDPQNIFFLGDQQQSGCLVCHGDRKLTKIVDGRPKSFYVNVNDLKASPHKNVACTSCHKDFGNTNHTVKSADWKIAASLACIRCHDHNKQYIDYSKGIHGQLSLQGKAGKGGLQAPACGDCHSGHKIKQLKDNPQGKEALRAESQKVCGDCHDDYWKSYDDYYHGKALKSGAKDAPTCWDCHGYHEVQKKDNPASMVTKANLPRTCDKCHADSSPEFIEYAKLIHGMNKEKDENLAYSLIQTVFGKVGDVFGGLFGLGADSGSK
ncbi:MAG: hypothetical protein ACYC1U_03255 [Candidatus Aquicultorales bacterium]